MAKRRSEKTSPDTTTVATNGTPAPLAEAGGGWWPESFLAPRATACIVAAGIVATLVMVLLIMGEGFIGTKQVFAYLLGLSNPYDIGVPPNGRDAGTVMIALVWFLIGLAIHPAMGVGVLVFLRPWDDGYTFRTDNIYFVWGFALCFIVWGVRAVLRGDLVRGWRPALLFAAYPAIGFLLSSTSIYYYDTYRALMLWTCYVFSFFLVANVAAEPRARRILFSIILLTVTAEAVFAIVQYRYILPTLRGSLQADPDLVRTMFGADPDSPELVRRFNINRAWGTVLFPNALAAFLITWLPLLVSTLWNSLVAWRDAPTNPAGRLKAGDQRRIVGVALVIWFVVAATLFGVFQFPMTFLPASQLPAYLGPNAAPLTASLLALLPAVGIYLVAQGRGLAHALLLGRAAVQAIAVLINLAALYLTFSRGAFLALAIAAGFGALLLIIPADRVISRIPGWLRRLALPAAASLAVFLLVAQAPAPDASPPSSTPPAATSESAAPARNDASDQVTVAGQDVSFTDLTDPATFRARLGYWKVAAKVFLAHPFTGVGFGAFSWAYPNFQYLGAADVQIAHNAYLQSFAETGLFGGLALLLFCGFVVASGALRTMQEGDPAKRRLYLGLTVGLMAFFLHSFIDINFSHPTLMMLAAVAAGLLFALPESTSVEASPHPARASNIALLPALVIVTLCCGMGLRVFAQDASISRAAMLDIASDREPGMRYATAEHFLQNCLTPALKGDRPPFIYAASALTLFPDVKELSAYGSFFAPIGENKIRQIGTGEMLPPNALYLVNKPYKMLLAATDKVLKNVAEYEAIDARIPYNFQLALEISRYYRLIGLSNYGPERTAVWTSALDNAVKWAEIAIARNPHFAGARAHLCQVYLLRAAYIKDRPNQDELLAAWRSIKKAAELAPVDPTHWGGMHTVGNMLADAYERAGQADRAEETRKEAQLAGDHAGWLVTRRVQLGIDPAPRKKANAPEATGEPAS